jgi:hypothetical protein
MSTQKTPLGGHPISRKEAFKGLGNPKTWQQDARAIYTEFRAKPKQKEPHLKLFQNVKKTVQRITRMEGINEIPAPSYAKSEGKAGAGKKKPRLKKVRKSRKK